MAYTTQVHSYTLKVPTFPSSRSFYHYSIKSVMPLDIEGYLKKCLKGSVIVDNGMVEATEICKGYSPDSITLRGYKIIHENRTSRGEFSSNMWVPEDWDENHPIMEKVNKLKDEQRKSEDSYYSRLWV